MEDGDWCKSEDVEPLENALEDAIAHDVYQQQRIEEFKYRIEELEQAIKDHKDSFDNPDDHTTEDIELWNVLKKDKVG